MPLKLPFFTKIVFVESKYFCLIFYHLLRIESSIKYFFSEFPLIESLSYQQVFFHQKSLPKFDKIDSIRYFSLYNIVITNKKREML